jgi:gag-polyprotein putative aspartyl protease/Aspartyl protease
MSRLGAIVGGAVMAAILAVPACASADCKLLLLAEFKLDPNSYAPVVDGSINGHPVKVLIDSGAGFSMVTAHEAQALGLPTVEMRGMRAYGIGGDTQLYRAHISQLKIGDLQRANMDLYVAGDTSASWPFAIVLGEDFLSKVDVEFDLPDKAIRLFEPKGCTAPQLIYWGAAYSQAPLLPWDPLLPAIQTNAYINGKRLLAELDSGAERSVVDAVAADADGVSRPPPTAGAQPMQGMGPRPEQTWTGRFDSFAFGEEKISHVDIRVLQFSGGMTYSDTGTNIPRRLENTPSMFVGDDFLHAHRVFIDNQDHLILFSYQGGPVFSVPGPSDPPAAK